MGAAVAAVLTLTGAPAPAGSAHVAVTPDGVVWRAAPPVFRPGAEMAVIHGDLSQPGPFVVRMKAPAGFTIMPHGHPADENLTVLSGTVAMGMGDAVDETAATECTGRGPSRSPT